MCVRVCAKIPGRYHNCEVHVIYVFTICAHPMYLTTYVYISSNATSVVPVTASRKPPCVAMC